MENLRIIEPTDYLYIPQRKIQSSSGPKNADTQISRDIRDLNLEQERSYQIGLKAIKNYQ